MNEELGALLAELREEAKLTQKQMVDALISSGARANQTRVSRLEQGDGDLAEALLYLSILSTPKADRLSSMLSVDWAHLPQPTYRHPNLEVLVEIEEALAKIANFLANGSVKAVLAGQAELLQRRLEHAGRYLLSLNHDIVYIGEIGVGKTTAACRQAGMVIDDATASDLKGVMLDTGGGRTTLCDVRVQTGDRYCIDVDPVPDEEIYRLVTEICRGLKEKLGEAQSQVQVEFKPAEEVERAIRNMADLPRPGKTRKGAPPLPDPAMELASNIATLEDLSAEFDARLGLWRRKRRQIEFEGADLSTGKQWVKATFNAINNGRHPEFALPAQITITVPFPLLRSEGLSISVVDTRGIDLSAIRSDILEHLNDERAVNVLCSKWGSAPEVSIQDLLKHVIETNADRTLLKRVAVIAMARTGDAESMRYDNGDSAETIEEGYEIKLNHVEDALQKLSLSDVATFAFNSSSDDPHDLGQFILKRIQSVRMIQADAARATIDAIDQMFANLEEAHAMAALETVTREISIFSKQYAELPGQRKASYERLLTSVRNQHARSVWAATRRAGRFINFDVFQHLGDGAAADAKSRSRKFIEGLDTVITVKLGDPDLRHAHGFLREIQANIGEWETDFVNAARHLATNVYFQPLTSAREIWIECERPYGYGINYRDHVASTLLKWFEANEGLNGELEKRMQRAWATQVLKPLHQATGSLETFTAVE